MIDSFKKLELHKKIDLEGIFSNTIEAVRFILKKDEQYKNIICDDHLSLFFEDESDGEPCVEQQQQQTTSKLRKIQIDYKQCDEEFSYFI